MGNHQQFIKAWAYLCRTQASKSESSVLLPQELQPFLDREAILDPRGIADGYITLQKKTAHFGARTPAF